MRQLQLQLKALWEHCNKTHGEVTLVSLMGRAKSGSVDQHKEIVRGIFCGTDMSLKNDRTSKLGATKGNMEKIIVTVSIRPGDDSAKENTPSVASLKSCPEPTTATFLIQDASAADTNDPLASAETVAAESSEDKEASKSKWSDDKRETAESPHDKAEDATAEADLPFESDEDVTAQPHDKKPNEDEPSLHEQAVPERDPKEPTLSPEEKAAKDLNAMALRLGRSIRIDLDTIPDSISQDDINRVEQAIESLDNEFEAAGKAYLAAAKQKLLDLRASCLLNNRLFEAKQSIQDGYPGGFDFPQALEKIKGEEYTPAGTLKLNYAKERLLEFQAESLLKQKVSDVIRSIQEGQVTSRSYIELVLDAVASLRVNERFVAAGDAKLAKAHGDLLASEASILLKHGAHEAAVKIFEELSRLKFYQASLSVQLDHVRARFLKGDYHGAMRQMRAEISGATIDDRKRLRRYKDGLKGITKLIPEVDTNLPAFERATRQLALLKAKQAKEKTGRMTLDVLQEAQKLHKKHLEGPSSFGNSHMDQLLAFQYSSNGDVVDACKKLEGIARGNHHAAWVLSGALQELNPFARVEDICHLAPGGYVVLFLPPGFGRFYTRSLFLCGTSQETVDESLLALFKIDPEWAFKEIKTLGGFWRLIEMNHNHLQHALDTKLQSTKDSIKTIELIRFVEAPLVLKLYDRILDFLEGKEDYKGALASLDKMMKGVRSKKKQIEFRLRRARLFETLGDFHGALGALDVTSVAGLPEKEMDFRIRRAEIYKRMGEVESQRDELHHFVVVVKNVGTEIVPSARIDQLLEALDSIGELMEDCVTDEETLGVRGYGHSSDDFNKKRIELLLVYHSVKLSSLQKFQGYKSTELKDAANRIVRIVSSVPRR